MRLLSRIALVVAASLGLASCGSSTVASPPSSQASPPPSPAPGATPWSVHPDLAYATASPAEKLDLIVPTSGGEPFPVLVFVHGGGWEVGDKSSPVFAPFLPMTIARGFAVASINYRLSGEATFPAQILDVKAAVRWIRANAARYGLDPDRIAAMGESAGGHLVAMLGTTGGVRAFDDPRLGNAGVSSSVQAVVDWYGPADLLSLDRQLALVTSCKGKWEPHDSATSSESALFGAPIQSVAERVRQADPSTYLTPDRQLPPFLIQHGDADCVVPLQQSLDLAAAIRSAAGEGAVRMDVVREFGHYTDFDLAGQFPVALDFLERVLKG